MSNSRPLYVHYNGVSMKVSSWQRDGDRISVGIVVRGDKAASDLMATLQETNGIVSWDDEPPSPATLLDATHRTIGEGPRAAHRVDVSFELGNPSPPGSEPLTLEERVSALEQEVQDLRRMISAAAGDRRRTGFGSAPSNLTLIETETFDEN